MFLARILTRPNSPHAQRPSGEGEQEELEPQPPVRPGSKVHLCPECGSLNLIEDFDQGETICHDCGLVLTQNSMSHGPEWRAVTKKEKDSRGRVGISTSFAIHEKRLFTSND